MKNFKTFISEEKNTHMQHIEDRVWDSGVVGVRQGIDYLRTLRDQLSGKTPNAMNISVKWDGAPAIFAGTDPSDGKFFVAKKGIFNKNPKVYKTNKDIDDDTSGELNKKMKLALKHLPELGIKGVVQGDFLYDRSDIKKVSIGGVPHITFHPNTILYAVPAESDLAKEILSSKIGVVWHTEYRGRSFEKMSASFGKEIASRFKKSKDSWAVDAVFKDVSGQATFTKAETDEMTALLSQAGKNFNKVSAKTFDLVSEGIVNARLNVFVNSKVRQGERVKNPKAFAVDLKAALEEYFQKEEDKRKSEKGKTAVRDKKSDAFQQLESIPQAEFEAMVNLYNNLVDAKHMVIRKLDKASKVGTFLKTKNGLDVTAPEGYVAVDHMGKNAVKLVDRLQFSKANFSDDILKGWTK